MQNSPSKFAFYHFSPLSFNPPQFNLPLTFHLFLLLTCPNLIFNFYFIIYFLIKKTLIKKKPRN